MTCQLYPQHLPWVIVINQFCPSETLSTHSTLGNVKWKYFDLSEAGKARRKTG